MFTRRTIVLIATSWLFLIQSTLATEANVEIDGSLRGSSHVSRELWGTSRQWSFTNILFHLGVCHADSNCEQEHHPPGPLHCGCPDCNKPHPPHFQNSYCENLASSSSESSVESDSTEDESSVNESDSTGGNQKASRRFSPWIFAAGAAVAGFVAAAVYVQKKRQEEVDDRSVPLTADGSAAKADAFGIGAASVAFGAIMMKMGLKAPDKTDTDDDDDASVGSVKNAVSTRKSLVEQGLRVPPVYPEQSAPSFVPIPRDPSNPAISQTQEGLEVGDYRPSSVHMAPASKPSTPYVV